MAEALDYLEVCGGGREEIKQLLKGCYAVTDSNVYNLYGGLFGAVSVIPAGEESKNFGTLERLLNDFLAAGLDRSSVIAAVGGGVTGDLAGFAASVYMRGIRVIQIPTTLLAMADSAVGGKTAVNLSSAKNAAGTFWQPERVILAPFFLETLPHREFVCGMGEVLKTAALFEGFYLYMRENLDRLLSGDTAAVFRAAELCARRKLGIVNKDERESGLRKILNFGHTLGHAYEVKDNFRLSHGQYVLMGMAAELALFEDKVDAMFYRDFCAMIARLSGSGGYRIEEVADIIMHDKKNKQGKICFVIPRAAGRTEEFFLSLPELFDRAREKSL